MIILINASLSYIIKIIKITKGRSKESFNAEHFIDIFENSLQQIDALSLSVLYLYLYFLSIIVFLITFK